MNPETPFPRQRERIRPFAPRVFGAARVEDVLAERTRAMAAGSVLAERTQKNSIKSKCDPESQEVQWRTRGGSGQALSSADAPCAHTSPATLCVEMSRPRRDVAFRIRNFGGARFRRAVLPR